MNDRQSEWNEINGGGAKLGECEIAGPVTGMIRIA